MTNPIIEPETSTPEIAQDKDERKRRVLLLILLLLLLLFCCAGYLFVRYLIKPQPVTQMLPVVNQAVYYPPTYSFSITGVDKPVAVALSADGSRIYVAEAAGDRLVKIFDRDGNRLGSFSPFGTTNATRQPSYLAVDSGGRVFVVDRLNNAIDLFDAEGNYLDVILAQDMTATKLLASQFPGGLPQGTTFYYEGINRILYYNAPGQPRQALQVQPSQSPWGPLGIRFDAQGNLLYTDIVAGKHSVHIIPAADLNAPWVNFNPQISSFGVQGSDPGQFNFPNMAVTDSRGNFYVSDGNNARISAWTPDQKYKTFFGFGGGDVGLNLPRGIWMDNKDHLHVVDAIGSTVRVYDISGAEPAFLYRFGSLGVSEGQFNFPNDIYIDGTGRLYIADGGNNRVQVWSY